MLGNNEIPIEYFQLLIGNDWDESELVEQDFLVATQIQSLVFAYMNLRLHK